ncbi:hypothetical protein MMC11_000029 [Xylographa trunciseda]|nr:hypothetical protein [Xylographa trunciseda]
MSNYDFVYNLTESAEEIDLYEILEITRGASKAEIKKAYHKAALASHPDKVAAEDREAADVRFKVVSQAYEILYDEGTRDMYDAHGMAAFEKGQGGMPEYTDMNDIINQFFQMGGGMPPGFEGSRSKKPRKGPDQIQDYPVTIEDLYKGKSKRIKVTKNVICGHCKGTGAKTKAKAHECGSCGGRGATQKMKHENGYYRPVIAECSECHGQGHFFKDKDKCKKCGGKRIIEESKVVELYIPKGNGDKIKFKGEADQVPGQIPGDIVVLLKEKAQSTFIRKGEHLLATINIALAESLFGFSRVVLKHVDGRGLHMSRSRGQITKPGQTFKIAGEGMPIKRTGLTGDLYLTVNVVFPDDGWSPDQNMITSFVKAQPPSQEPIVADTVEDVEYDDKADIHQIKISDSRINEDDEDDEAADLDGAPQCAQQ